MIKIEYIHTDRYTGENTVMKPDKKFNSIDEAYDWALAHGANPWKNVKYHNV